ncbi:MAG: cobalamin biosynthesis protein [Nitrosopumilus sp.]|nr:cobalamin biosynthesis protein [Nitrosopumilus sp.]
MIFESLFVIGVALILDFIFGDPKNKLHPTAWIGLFIAKLVPITKNKNSTIEKLGGIMIIVVTSSIAILLLLSFEYAISLIAIDYVSIIISMLFGGLLLKTTIAIRGMENHAKTVLMSLDDKNLEAARSNLSMIVKRNTKNLDKNHIISGVLESISENTVDGITGPLFYYAFFGLPGAFVYRVINTADSMIGYKTDIFKNIGWFTASCDTVLNYIPSRLTGLIMIISAAVLQNNWKESYRVMIRDGKKTDSPNAGYPMAALAGALETKFEKVDHYNLGDGKTPLTNNHVYLAIRIMKLTSIFFVGIVSIPVIFLLMFVGWWVHA